MENNIKNNTNIILVSKIKKRELIKMLARAMRMFDKITSGKKYDARFCI